MCLPFVVVVVVCWCRFHLSFELLCM
jgi:hypothetical protein